MLKSFFRRHKSFLLRRGVLVGGVALAVVGVVAGLWLQASAATGILVPDGTVSSNWTGAYTNIDEGQTTTADYINTTTADAARTAEFTLSSLSNVDSASSITLYVCAYYPSTTQGGGIYDDLDFGLRIAGTLQPLTTVTPAYKASATSCTMYSATYSGTYSQSDIDSLQVYLNRTIRGSGKPRDQPDDMRVVNAYVNVTYAEPLPPVESQVASRFYEKSNLLGDENGWYDTSWGNRRKLSINNTQVTDTLQNFPVRVSLTPANFDYSKAKTGGADLRFTDSDGITALSYEIETWNPGSTSEVWVKVPEVTASSNDSIYVYYNNSAATSAQNPAGVWSNGYTGVWHLGENPAAAQPQFYDSTGKGRNGQSVGGMNSGDSVIAKIGNGLRTDGLDDYMSVDTTTDFNLNGSFNLQLYARATSQPESSPFPSLIGKGLSSGTDGWVIFLNTSTKDVRYKRNNFSWTFDNTGSFSTTHKNYSMNYNKTSSTLSMYSNGASTFDYTGVNFVTNNSTDPLRLGFRDEPLNGQFDELRISNVSRSAQWIKADYLSMENSYLTAGAEESYTPGTYGAGLTPLAAQDTATTLTQQNLQFRLRMLFKVSQNTLAAGASSYKLQVSPKSGTCDVGFSGETFSDVSPTSGLIRYFDNPTLANNAAIGSSANDPTYSGDTVRQTYRESNPFTTTASAQNGNNIMWDFALDASNATPGAYCLRVVKSTGTVLNTYTKIPEFIVASGEATQANYRWFSNANSITPGSPLAAQDTATTTPVSTPFRLRQRLAVDNGQIAQSTGKYKLQYAQKVDICDPAFSGENYISIIPNEQSSVQNFVSSAQTVQESGNVPWFSIDAIKTDDGSEADATLYDLGSAQTNYLIGTNLNYSIPGDAVIEGIELIIDRGSGSPGVTEREIRLVKGGDILGSNLTTNSSWTSSLQSWGGPTEKWGLSWTPAEINSANFGAAIKLNLFNDGVPSVRAAVDYMAIKVYYATPGTQMSSVLAYYDNTSVTSTATISSTPHDPTNSARPVVLQSYQEIDPFSNSIAAIPAGSDGLWDFSLVASAAADGKTYCIRTVKSDGSLLANYSYIPEVTIGAAPPSGPTLEQQLRGGQSVINGVKNPYSW